MKKVFYSIAVLLAVAWITSFFILNTSGASVHILLFLATICSLHATILPQKKYMLDGRIRGATEEDAEEQRA